MEKYNYISALKTDIIAYIMEEYPVDYSTDFVELEEQFNGDLLTVDSITGTEVNVITSQLYIAGVIDTTIVDLTTKYTIAAANNSPIADIILADIKQAIKEALMKVW